MENILVAPLATTPFSAPTPYANPIPTTTFPSSFLVFFFFSTFLMFVPFNKIFSATAMTGPRPNPTPTSMPSTDNCQLWMGEIDTWMDENYLYSLFSATHTVTGVKIIRDKKGGNNNYAFITFPNSLIAQTVLDTYNNRPIPGTQKIFK